MPLLRRYVLLVMVLCVFIGPSACRGLSSTAESKEEATSDERDTASSTPEDSACVSADTADTGGRDTALDTAGEKDTNTQSDTDTGTDTNPKNDTDTAFAALPFCAWDLYSYCCADGSGVGTEICDAWSGAHECDYLYVCCELYQTPYGTPGPGGCEDDVCWIPGEPFCGDGEINVEGEACDDGNQVPGDGCTESCRIEVGFVCPYPGSSCTRMFFCGNGVLENLEVCDDGNNYSADGCSWNCAAQDPGYYCLVPGQLCIPVESCGDCLEPVCGNGIVETGERCDDGRNDGGYGECAPGCVYGARCGDGILQPEQEACDDGANRNGYGECGPGCVLGPRCGDGLVQPGFEVCDDGEVGGQYGECSTSCNGIVRCGDGLVQTDFEDCDDGNDVPNDFCDNQCRCADPAKGEL